MQGFFLQNVWAGLSLWVALYISDYALTLKCAHLYQSGVRDKIAFDGSYEITPQFQRDIDSLRVVSPRFVLSLVLTSVLLVVLWQLVGQSTPQIYSFALGALIAVQLTIHIRHVRNLSLFRAAGSDAVRGRIEYSRPLVLRLSSVEVLAFAGLFIVLFAFTYSWFVLGGAVACLSLAGKHWRLVRARVSATEPA